MKGEFDRTIMVYIDSYEDCIPVGRFHIVSQQDAQPFKGLCQLFLGINDALDQNNFPQSFFELRKFHTPSELSDSRAVLSNRCSSQLATFRIRILFRQNASWQGSVSWIEGNQEEYFRSVLELIVLMDDALNHAAKL